jgi:hypothetical protein
MAAFIGEGGVEHQAWFSVDARLGCWGFKYSQEHIFGL